MLEDKPRRGEYCSSTNRGSRMLAMPRRGEYGVGTNEGSKRLAVPFRSVVNNDSVRIKEVEF